MNARQYTFLVVVAAVTGLIGGLVSGRTFAPNAAVAGEMQPDALTGVQSGRPTAIRGESLELVDKSGKLYARLGLGPKNQPHFAIYNRVGVPVFSSGLASSGSARLAIRGKGGATIRLAVGGNGAPSFDISDKKGKLRATLRLMSEGSPALCLQDQAGNARVVLGRILPELSVTPLPTRPVSSMVLFNEKEKVIWEAP